MKKWQLGAIAVGLATLTVGAIVYLMERQPKPKNKSIEKAVLDDDENFNKIEEFAELIPQGNRFVSLVEKLSQDLYIGEPEDADDAVKHLIWRATYTMHCLTIICIDGIAAMKGEGVGKYTDCFDKTKPILNQIVDQFEESTIRIHPLEADKSVDNLGKYFQHRGVRTTVDEILTIFENNINGIHNQMLSRPANQLAI